MGGNRSVVGLAMMSTLLGMVCFSLAFLCMAVASLLPFIPVSVHVMRRGLRAMLILSFRLYQLILSRVTPVFTRWGIDLLHDGYARITATMMLSLIMGCGLSLLIQLSINGVVIALALVHGLIVGLAWREIEEPGDFQLGVTIE